ncbi:MAG: FAD-binding protein, partial [Tannerellaceae bacterium]|nr:FAD-binding protein [Tannerellaceae bacterium]
MIKELQLRILPEEAADESSLKTIVARETGTDPFQIRAIRIVKRSIDARQRIIYVNLSLRVFINEDPELLEYLPVEYPDVSHSRNVVVVGAGPAGLFAA